MKTKFNEVYRKAISGEKTVRKNRTSAKAIVESRNSARKLYVDTGKVSPEVFQKILDFDPTETKKYAEWMCRQVAENKDLDIERFSIIKDYDKAALEQKITGPDKDIQKIRDIDQLEAITKKAVETVTSTQMKKAVGKMRETRQVPEAMKRILIYQNDKCFILNIEKKEDAIAFGKGTGDPVTKTGGWCIGYDTEGNNMFDDYFLKERNNIYYIIPFEPKNYDVRYRKMAALLKLDGTMEIWDGNNKRMTDGEVENMIKTFDLQGVLKD